jgi:D-amino-acid oxidase
MQVSVVGCGVTGLTTAVALRDAGHDAHIWAAELPFDTVSVVAGAIWAPSQLEPRTRVPGWALHSRTVFARLADVDATGVAPLRYVDLHRQAPAPTWGEDTPWVQRAPAEAVPVGYEAALVVDGFAIDPPLYLRWMIERFEASGGTITLGKLGPLDDGTPLPGDAVVNCAGLGARELVRDRSMFPIRGQTVAVTKSGPFDGTADESDPTRISYVYPRRTQLVLGGTRDTNDDNPEPDPTIATRILADAVVLEPGLAAASVIEHRVGFRPGRPEVRLEADRLPDHRLLVHNYGHGGAGYIMSWGCAAEVVSIIDASAANPSPINGC